jgi:hypothetical protein
MNLQISTHDVTKEPEPWYHSFLLAVLYPLVNDVYRVESNREARLGRSDITLHPPKGKSAIIIELKRPDKEEEKKIKADEHLCPLAQDALDQIKKKDYISGLSSEHRNDLILFGIAFHGKLVAVAMGC